MYSKHAVVWSQPGCIFCDMASRMLLSMGYTVEEKKIGANVTKADFMEANPGARSVPQIYLDGEIVPGGFVGLKAMLDD